ncbi:MAG TPA: DNA polymerase ligase N-terminal domain-containing protein [Gemmataceae bacterium]|nr:DNA polymerase ligase N-terminal domain-containing protein [Gemmataceae bacterium]
MPRFVILEHDWPLLHWDLMLEAGAVLRTWRLAEPLTADVEIAVTAIGNHRLHYLDYEGPVSGNRGSVVRRDSGTFDWQSDDGEVVAVRLAGARCRGLLEIQCEKGIARLFEP